MFCSFLLFLANITLNSFQDIIIAEAIVPEICNDDSPECLKDYSVREILVRKNLPGQNEEGFHL